MKGTAEVETSATLPFQIPAPGQRVRYAPIAWEQYEELGRELKDRPVRVTFDRGEMEIMVASEEHEAAKQILGRLIELLTFLMRIPVRSRGSMTFKRDDLLRGFEPDECYWIAREHLLRGKAQFDPATDPPPDLAVEVEISRSAVDRLGVYAAFGIPEVWRWDARRLRVMVLNAQGDYAKSPSSPAFPFLPMEDFAKFLALPEDQSETDWLWQFQSWVQENAARNWSNP